MGVDNNPSGLLVGKLFIYFIVIKNNLYIHEEIGILFNQALLHYGVYKSSSGMCIQVIRRYFC